MPPPHPVVLTLLQPSISHISIASLMLNIDQPKVNHGHLYLRTLEIIQLVEGPPPPPRIASVPFSSSSDYDSEPSSSSDDESESLCSSYCSSDIPLEQLDSETSQAQHSADGSDPETFSIRMKRILAWRENFAATMGTASSDTPLFTLKRKLKTSNEHEGGDAHSHSSKRSRSHRSSQGGLCAHSCPACDAFFSSPHCLRQHGLDAGANEGCSVAVDYAFE
jgi:hypothetical protein